MIEGAETTVFTKDNRWKEYIVTPPPKKVDENVSEDTKIWFLNLPTTYEGYSFFNVNDSWNGKGKHTWVTYWSPYRITSVGRKEYIAIFEYSHILSVPHDAHATMRKAADPESYCTSRFFYEIDRKKGTMFLLGSLTGNCTQPAGTFEDSSVKSKGVIKIGDWKFNIKKTDKELMLRGDKNQVLVAFNHWSRDFNKDITILFAKSKPEKILCPAWAASLRRYSKPIDLLEKNMKLWGELMECSLIEEHVKTPEVSCTYQFLNLDKFDSIAGIFQARFELQLYWQVTILDVIDYVALSSEERMEWTPAWLPPALRVVNNDSSGDLTLDVGKIELQIRGAKIMAAMKYSWKGCFFKKQELDSYPFDYQSLTISLQTEDVFLSKIPNFIIHQTCNKLRQPVIIYPSDWDLDSYYYRVETAEKRERDLLGHHTIDIALIVRRKNFAIVTKVIFMNFLFVLVTLLGFTFPSDDTNDRISLGVTMLLTATVYFISHDLPKVRFLTFIDIYSMSSFGFILVVTTQFSFLRGATSRIETILFWIDLFLFVTYNLVVYIMVMQHKFKQQNLRHSKSHVS